MKTFQAQESLQRVLSFCHFFHTYVVFTDNFLVLFTVGRTKVAQLLNVDVKFCDYEVLLNIIGWEGDDIIETKMFMISNFFHVCFLSNWKSNLTMCLLSFILLMREYYYTFNVF